MSGSGMACHPSGASTSTSPVRSVVDVVVSSPGSTSPSSDRSPPSPPPPGTTISSTATTASTTAAASASPAGQHEPDIQRRALTEQVLISSSPLLPLLDGHRVTDVVLPHAVDLEVALGDALVAEPQLLDHPPAPVVAGDDRHLDAVEVDLLEREPGQQDERLGHVALAGVAPVDPVADVADWKVRCTDDG